MIRLILFCLIVLALSAISIWMASHPGEVTFFWLGYRVDISATLLILLLALAIFSASLLLYGLYTLVSAPGRMLDRVRLKRNSQGLSLLTEGFASLAIGDMHGAETAGKKAQKLMGNSPLYLLLASEVARYQSDAPRTRLYLREMLGSRETEFLAALRLAAEEMRQGSYAEALSYAVQAHELRPDDSRAGHLLTDIYCRRQRWQEALAIAEKTWRAHGLDKAQYKHLRAAILCAQAQEALAKKDFATAAASLQQAVKLQPDFVPARLTLVELYKHIGEEATAIKAIYRAWKITPHPELAALFLGLITREDPLKQIKYTAKLASYNPSHMESLLIQAKAAMLAQEWDTARNYLKQACALRESARAFSMLAELEERAYQAHEAASSWLQQGMNAAPEETWLCASCHQAVPNWSLHCPQCDGFVTIAWKLPHYAFLPLHPSLVPTQEVESEPGRISAARH